MTRARNLANLTPSTAGLILTDDLDSAAKPLGVSQSWQDVTSSRAVGVTYTNTTGRSIVVSYFRGGSGADYTYMYLYVNGMEIAENSVYTPGGYSKPLGISGVVPAGATYRFEMATNGGSGDSWRELR